MFYESTEFKNVFIFLTGSVFISVLWALSCVHKHSQRAMRDRPSSYHMWSLHSKPALSFKFDTYFTASEYSFNLLLCMLTSLHCSFLLATVVARMLVELGSWQRAIYWLWSLLFVQCVGVCVPSSVWQLYRLNQFNSQSSLQLSIISTLLQRRIEICPVATFPFEFVQKCSQQTNWACCMMYMFSH